jgi:hypothetical protein
MDLVGLLKKNEQPLRNCCAVAGARQRPDTLTLSVGVPLSALNAQFGVLKKVFQVRAGHTGLNQRTSPPRLCAFSHTTFGDAGLLPAAHGGSWHRTSVWGLRRRLDELAGNDVKGLALKRPADVRAEALGLTIHKLRKADFVSSLATARELNEREIPTARGGKWHRTSVRRLMRRLENLEASSRTAVAADE